MASDKEFYQLSERVALLGQAVEGQQQVIKELTGGQQLLREDNIVIKTKWGMVAVLGGMTGSILVGLIVWIAKSKMGL